MIMLTVSEKNDKLGPSFGYGRGWAWKKAMVIHKVEDDFLQMQEKVWALQLAAYNNFHKSCIECSYKFVSHDTLTYHNLQR